MQHKISAAAGPVSYTHLIGTGINVNQEEFPEELRKTATSLYLETGKKYHRSRIIERILEALEEYYGIFVKTEDM